MARFPFFVTYPLRTRKKVINRFEDIPQAFQGLLDSGLEVVKADTDKLLESKEWGWRCVLKLPKLV